MDSHPKNSQIFVLFHLDPPSIPLPDNYTPIHCGYLGELEGYPYLTDRTNGEFLSSKADYYSELSGIYWAWQNSKADIIGTCHYRRFFTTYPLPAISRLKKYLYSNFNIKVNLAPRRTIQPNKISQFTPYLLDDRTIQTTLSEYDAILPEPLILKVSVRTHYEQHHQIADLELLEKIIKKNYPDFSEAFSQVMGSQEFYPYNMFVLNRDVFEEFMPWWFRVLADFESEIDLNSYIGYQKRILGYLSERLLTVWFKKNNHLRIKEFPLLFFKKLKTD
jgi:hypothetical protein